jgi:ribonucleoside-diphosphate reductase alpha chain
MGPAVAAVAAAAALATLSATNADLQAQLAAAQTQLAELTASSTLSSVLSDSQAPPRAVRHRLPSERAGITHKFRVADHEGYLTVGLYPNGQPGEIFIRMAKEGSTISGLMDSFATAISMCLQHGVPLKLLCEKFAHTRFEPSGWTGNEQIGYAKSIMDYLFRWMQLRFLSGQQLDLFAGLTPATPALPSPSVISTDAERSGETPVSSSGPSILDLGPSSSDPWSAAATAPLYTDRTPPQQGIAPDLTARAGLTDNPATDN